MFTTEGIILKHQEIRDRERSYVLFTRDYGKIRAFHKESPTRAFHDVGSSVEIGIDRKNETNRLTSIRLKSSVVLGHSFENTSFFLSILTVILKEIPDGGGDIVLYQDLLTLIDTSKDISWFSQSLGLMWLRMIHLLGNTPLRSDDPIIQKISALAIENTLNKLLLIRGIPDTFPHVVFSEFNRIFSPS